MKALKQKVITAYKNLIRCWSVEKKLKKTVEEKNIDIQMSRDTPADADNVSLATHPVDIQMSRDTPADADSVSLATHPA